MTHPQRRRAGIGAASLPIGLVALGLVAVMPAAAIAAPATASTATAATTATTAASSAAANSPAAALVADAAYRGAEHHFMVLNVAGAQGKFGASSKGAKASLAALSDNVTALSTLLTENDPAASGAVKSLLIARDNDELAYAAASLGVHKKVAGSATKQAQSLQSLSANETDVGTAFAALYPDTKAADVTKAFATVDTADEASLEAASRTGVDRFPKADAASTDLADLTTSVAAQEATAGKVAGDLLDNNALARIAGAIVATQHVYEVGSYLQTGLLTGTGSGQTKAAQFWVNVNSGKVSSLLAAEGTNMSLTMASWMGHIEGYRLYVAGISTGHKFDFRLADNLLTGYETSLSNEIALKLPPLSAATVKAGIVEHVDGTEQVAKDLKANNPRVYGEAEMGAQHLVDVFAEYAAAATITPSTATPKIVKL